MTQKAWLVEEPGGAFQEREIPRPVPSAGQVLVRIAASGINPLDTKIRAGAAAHARQPLPAVLGVDMAGTVEAAGPGVTDFAIGDQVYGMAGGVGGLQGTLAQFVAAGAALLAANRKTCRCARPRPFPSPSSRRGKDWSIAPM